MYTVHRGVCFVYTTLWGGVYTVGGGALARTVSTLQAPFSAMAGANQNLRPFARYGGGARQHSSRSMDSRFQIGRLSLALATPRLAADGGTRWKMERNNFAMLFYSTDSVVIRTRVTKTSVTKTYL